MTGSQGGRLVDASSGIGRISRFAARAGNAWRRARAGLAFGGENVSPECANDLFVAHLSIYHFFSRFTANLRVLELGCGTGYGSSFLAKSGAAHVTAIDIDPRNIAYARRHFPDVEYIAGDAALLAHRGEFDVVVSSNAFEHFDDPRAAIPHTAQFLLAVPPVFNEEWRALHAANEFHHSNLLIAEWRAVLEERFESVEGFVHLAPEGVTLDFNSPFRSRVSAEDFRFEPLAAVAQPHTVTITAIFRAKVGESR
jgi:SAM-dependent methyltransferase